RPGREQRGHLGLQAVAGDHRPRLGSAARHHGARLVPRLPRGRARHGRAGARRRHRVHRLEERGVRRAEQHRLLGHQGRPGASSQAAGCRARRARHPRQRRQPGRRGARLGDLRRRLGRQAGRGLRRAGREARRVLRPAHPAQARGAARARGQCRLRPDRRRSEPHDRAARPRRRRRRRRLPAMSQSTDSGGAKSGDVKSFAAIDLGASSGRVIRGAVGPDRLDVVEVHRFRNEPRFVREALRWDFAALERGAREGLRLAGPVDGIGIDSWAVDYGLLDTDGRLIDDPVHYRDGRTDGVADQVFKLISARRMYELTGIQNQPFNTVHQLYAAQQTAELKAAARILMVPDLLSWRLTGVAGTEVTNASTTGLFDTDTRRWSREIFEALRLDCGLFAPLRGPGEPAGVAADFAAPVFTVGSHDTASAVAAVPAEGGNFGYISSGTWSLVGVELNAPIRTEQSRAANFTNEIGVDGTVRYLRNVMGLWLLQECLREWGREG